MLCRLFHQSFRGESGNRLPSSAGTCVFPDQVHDLGKAHQLRPRSRRLIDPGTGVLKILFLIVLGVHLDHCDLIFPFHGLLSRTIHVRQKTPPPYFLCSVCSSRWALWELGFSKNSSYIAFTSGFSWEYRSLAPASR